MKIAIVGSRTFSDYNLLCEVLERQPKIDEIVSGGAKGADSLAKKYAQENNLKLVEFYPDWDRHGKSAGFIRNTDIITYADKVIAFWDGISKGTQHSFELASQQQKSLQIILF